MEEYSVKLKHSLEHREWQQMAWDQDNQGI